MPRRAPRLRPGATIPDRIDETGLVLTYTPDGGSQRVIDFTDAAGSVTLRREAIRGLKAMTATDGPWRRRSTVNASVRYVQHLLGWCDENSVTSFSDLAKERFLAYDAETERRDAPSTRHHRMVAIRPFIRAVAEVPQAARWEAERRFGAPARSTERDYYTKDEFHALERAALRVVSQARRRVRLNHERVQAARTMPEHSRADSVLLDHFDGRPTSTKVRKRWLNDPSPATGPVTWHHLFMLTPEEVLAAAVLLVCRNGWNLSVLLSMTTGDSSGSVGQEQDITMVGIDKPRRQQRRHSSTVLVDDGASSDGAAWRLVVEATDPARAFLRRQGVPTKQLMVFSGRGGPNEREVPVLWPNVRVGLPKDERRQTASWVPDGLLINFPQLRRTHQTLIARAPRQNTMKTHVLKYLSLSPEVQAEVDATIAAGQAQLLARSEEGVTLRLSAEADVSEDIAQGRQDTATVACRDISQHPVTGLPCTDSFLMCLLCSNAVATPRHLPRLVLLHQALEDQRSALTDAAWERWRADHLRLSAFLFNSARVTDDTYRLHLQAATEADRNHVRDLLGGDLDALA